MCRNRIVKRLAVVAVCAAFALALPGTVFAQAVQPLFTSKFQREMSGLYMGTIDFNPLGIDRFEPVGVSMDILGQVIFTSEFEETEREGAGTGMWRHVGGGVIRITLTAIPPGRRRLRRHRCTRWSRRRHLCSAGRCGDVPRRQRWTGGRASSEFHRGRCDDRRHHQSGDARTSVRLAQADDGRLRLSLDSVASSRRDD